MLLGFARVSDNTFFDPIYQFSSRSNGSIQQCQQPFGGEKFSLLVTGFRNAVSVPAQPHGSSKTS